MAKHEHPLYKRWQGMMSRCFNKNYPHYVGDTVTVTRRWQNFHNYARDIESNFGLPSGPEDRLLRKNTQKDFSLKNIVGWASFQDIACNRITNLDITYKGQTKTLSEWSLVTGINPRTIWSRINDYGYTPEQALTKKPNKGIKYNTLNK